MSDAPTSPEQPSSFIQELKLPSFSLSLSQDCGFSLQLCGMNMYKCTNVGKEHESLLKAFPE